MGLLDENVDVCCEGITVQELTTDAALLPCLGILMSGLTGS